ncbi:dipeptidyl aminopeptidase/acylaminoacyl peptidase [Chitinophaga skermanii]|uniref:Dipeptidyl aminopeptidase/acylaminoacyl peptidase n=1 Tax=Chitinophaga skermanii TaxID=331697 RepID=A0A327QIV9_9BACT|nr:S9 family peptidase [Chitinophaga skermanii]RAJ01647.1 dipeptidyl aminopeptidase/acylaminoacyl peptidase [Chitinophaga skermanii]
MRSTFLLAGILFMQQSMAQQKMTPEMLWQLGRVSGETLTADGKSVIYGVSNYNIAENRGERNLFVMPVTGGTPRQLTSSKGNEGNVQTLANGRLGYNYKGQYWEMDADGSNAVQKTNFPQSVSNIRVSADGKYILFSKDVKIEKVSGADFYEDMPKSNVQIYTNLNYRHWDTWEDGYYSHIFVAPYNNGQVGEAIDLLEGKPYDCPQMPSGGAEDFIFSPDSKKVIYVCKKKHGKEYAVSTNTDIYAYDIATKQTTNLSEGMMGYDVQPAFNKDGSKLVWLSMARDGFEADKQDVVLYDFKSNTRTNLTKDWDGTVSSVRFSNDEKKIQFLAVVKGTSQLHEIALQPKAAIKQITKGQFDINDIIGETKDALIVSKTDMNHAAELFNLSLKTGALTQLTTVNNDTYSKIGQSKVEERWVKTTDGKDMLVWVIFPPNFDPAKKYPTLLYCQGGPQSALSQFYSYRWNFQLMAAQGYIVVAPNRRGMPGHGVEWNEQISKDWGGQPIRDYLSAIDDVSKESYVDKDRRAAVGASYGGYSVFMLAGVHENRFKSFIAHDGLFDIRSWYGTTEELWFANWDIGNYWDRANAHIYEKFNPSQFVDKWNTPIMIVQGGIDFRVGIEQGLQAFQVAQLKGIKSKLLYFPEENHWVLGPQNAIIWQREFFKWLQETL